MKIVRAGDENIPFHLIFLNFPQGMIFFINPLPTHIDKGFDTFMHLPAWKQFRELIKAERGERCEDKEHERGKAMTNIVLDHIVELKDGGEKLARSNVMLRCRSCHVRKTAAEQRHRNEVEYWQRQSRLTGGDGKIPEKPR